jgi:hypothetical protein
VAFTFAARICFAVFHTTPLLGALHGAGSLLWGFPIDDQDYYSITYSSLTVYTALLSMFFSTNFARAIFWAVIKISAKWLIMGQRKEGHYNWDTSNYAQRWELYQAITRDPNVWPP